MKQTLNNYKLTHDPHPRNALVMKDKVDTYEGHTIALVSDEVHVLGTSKDFKKV